MAVQVDLTVEAGAFGYHGVNARKIRKPSAAGLSHFPTGLREASQFHFRQGLI